MAAEDEDWQRARDLALNYLSYRPRSSKEVYERLRRKGYSDEVAHDVIEYLTERRYLDDRMFAEDWADFSVNRKLSGRILLRQELRLKGIPAEIIDDAVRRAYEPEGREKEIALRLVRKRIRSFRKGNKEKLMRSLISLLTRHGFSRSIIRDAVLEVLGGLAGDEYFDDFPDGEP